MATTNSDLKSFAIFINSKTAIYKDNTKSTVTIPFTANIAIHEPHKIFKFTFNDMLFTNSFYNIRPGIESLKVITTFAPGRGFADTHYRLQPTISVPYGNYDFDSLVLYLNSYLGFSENVVITYGGLPTTITSYQGFGAISSVVGTLDTQASVADFVLGKLTFNTPDLWNLTQFDTDINTVPDIPLACSYLVSGVYLVVDSQTIGLMKMLGFVNNGINPTLIPGTTDTYGFGLPVFSKTLNVGGTAPNNTTLFGVKNSSGTIVYGIPDQAIDQDIFSTLEPTNFSDFSGLDELYVHCPQFRTQFLSSTNLGPLAASDVIAVIPLNVTFGQKMSYIPAVPLSGNLLNTNISQLDFVITNSNGALLDFHGVNWSMTLNCEEQLDESKFQQQDGGTPATPFQLTNLMMNSVDSSISAYNRKMGGGGKRERKNY